MQAIWSRTVVICLRWIMCCASGEYVKISYTICLFAVIRCYFFGDTSSNRDPRKYLQCIYALYDYYREELCKSKSSKSSVIELPLIVNTPGWVKGMFHYAYCTCLSMPLFAGQFPLFLFFFTYSMMHLSPIYILHRYWIWSVSEDDKFCCSDLCC